MSMGFELQDGIFRSLWIEQGKFEDSNQKLVEQEISL